MIIKQCQFHGRDDNGVYVHLLRAGYDNDHLVKEAQVSAPLLAEVQSFMKGLNKRNGMLYTLVSALGAGEYWGSNCLPAGTPVTMGDGSSCPIESIAVGDEVVSHTGAVRRVAKVFQHQADGLVGIRPQGHPRSLYTTSGHPYYAVKRGAADVLKKNVIYKRPEGTLLPEAREEFASALEPSWIEAGNLEKGDLVFLKVEDRTEVHPELGDVGTAFLLGAYAAEGCLGRRRRKDRNGEPWQWNKVIFTIGGSSTALADRVEEELRRRDLSPYRTDNYQGNNAIRIEVGSQRLARVCLEHVGHGAKAKRLSPSIMMMPLEWQAEFLAGYFDGDGCTRKDDDKHAGSVRGSTSSEELALDVRMLLARLGVVASVIPGVQHSTSLGAGNPIYEISVPSGQLGGKVTRTESMVHPKGYLVCPVKTVTEDEAWSGSVYNIEVEVDNSYVADRVVVHNSNGDYFPESSLIHTPPNWNDMGLRFQRTMGSQWEWGYPTFYNAHAFQHHMNKDPERAFGSVEYVCWDSPMKRVLLVVGIDRNKAHSLGAHGVVDRIENGEFPDVSMGCRVPYDLCSICADWSRITGNSKKDMAEHRRSPIRGLSVTTKDYCQHLQFEVGKIYPDGRRVWMWNLHPRFFDISFVYIGADKASKVMAKLASACPIRPGHKKCAKGCYDCDIPSSHVHEVWSKEKVAMQLTPFEEFVVQHNREDRDAGEIQDISQEEMARLRKAWKEKTAAAPEAFLKFRPRPFATSVKKSVSKAAPSVTTSTIAHEEELEKHKRDQQLQQAFTKTSYMEDDTDPRIEAEVNQYFKEKRAQRRVFWDGVDSKGNRVGGVVEEGTPEWERYQKSQPEGGHVIRIGGGKSPIEKISSLPLHKQAEIIKRIRSHFSSSLPRIDDQEDDIPEDVLDMMSDRLSDACSTAGSMGIVLKPREFQRSYLSALGHRGMADDLDDMGISFRRSMEPSDDFKLSDRIVPSILKALMPMIQGRSALGPSIHRRMMRITIAKQGEPTKTIVMDSGFRTPEGRPLEDHPLLQKVGAAYSGYRRQLIYKVASMVPRAIHEHPEVLGEVYRGSISRQGLVKEGGDVVQSLLGMFPATYLNRAYLSEPVSDFVEGHCNLGGLLASGELAERGGVA